MSLPGTNNNRSPVTATSIFKLSSLSPPSTPHKLSSITSPTNNKKSPSSSSSSSDNSIPSPTKKNHLLEPIKQDDEVTIHRLISIQHTRSFTIGRDPTDYLPTDQNGTHKMDEREISHYDHEEESKMYTLQRNEIMDSLRKISDDIDDDLIANLNNHINNKLTIADDEFYDNDALDIIYHDDNNMMEESKAREITFTMPSHTQYGYSRYHDEEQSITHFGEEIDAIQHILNEHKMNEVDDDKKIDDLLNISLSPKKRINAHKLSVSHTNNIYKRDNTHNSKSNSITVPLQNKAKHKIKREKTPIPSEFLSDAKKKSKSKQKSKSKSKSKHGHRNGNGMKIIEINSDIDDNNNNPKSFKSISGHLEKKSASKFVGWQKRWFYLWKDTLDYYKESSLQIRGSINLWNVEYIGKTNECQIILIFW